MKTRILAIFFIFTSLLYADENPFKTDQNITLVAPPEFQKEEVKFNSSARILKSITFNYINLDGSEDKIDLDVNKSIDWHDTYTISRFKSPDPSKVLDVSVTIPEKIALNKNQTQQPMLKYLYRLQRFMILFLMRFIKIK